MFQCRVLSEVGGLRIGFRHWRTLVLGWFLAISAVPTILLSADLSTQDQRVLSNLRNTMQETLNLPVVPDGQLPGRSAHIDLTRRSEVDDAVVDAVKKNPHLAPQILNLVREVNSSSRINANIGLNEVVQNAVRAGGPEVLGAIAQAFPEQAPGILGLAMGVVDGEAQLHEAINQVLPHADGKAAGEIGFMLGNSDAIGINVPFQANVNLAANLAVQFANLNPEALDDFMGRMNFLVAAANADELHNALGARFAQAFNNGQLNQEQVANAAGQIAAQLQGGDFNQQLQGEGPPDPNKVGRFLREFLANLDPSRMNAQQAANLIAAVGNQVLANFEGEDRDALQNLMLGFLAQNLPGGFGQNLEALLGAQAAMRRGGNANLPEGLGDQNLLGGPPPPIVIQSVPVNDQADAGQDDITGSPDEAIQQAEQFAEDRGGVGNLSDDEIVDIIDLFTSFGYSEVGELAEFGPPAFIIVHFGAENNELFQQALNEAIKRGLELGGLKIVRPFAFNVRVMIGVDERDAKLFGVDPVGQQVVFPGLDPAPNQDASTTSIAGGSFNQFAGVINVVLPDSSDNRNNPGQNDLGTQSVTTPLTNTSNPSNNQRDSSDSQEDAIVNGGGNNGGGPDPLNLCVTGSANNTGANGIFFVNLGDVSIGNGQTLFGAVFSCLFPIPDPVPGGFPTTGTTVKITATGGTVQSIQGGVQLNGAQLGIQGHNLDLSNCSISGTAVGN